MARATFVKKARKDIEGTEIKKGDSYYWWKFRFGGKRYSKTPPSRSQLTQSGFLGTLYEIEDRMAAFTCDNKEDFDEFKSELVSDIESLRDECQNSLDNMPEQLQSAPTGELLQERIDALESWSSEIEGIECEDYDEESLREEMLSDYEKEDQEGEDDYKERIDQEVANKIQEFVDAAIEELNNTSANL